MTGTLFQTLKDKRFLRLLAGGSVVVALGAGTAAAFTRTDTADAPPDAVVVDPTTSVPGTTPTTPAPAPPVTAPETAPETPPETLPPATVGTAPSTSIPDTPEADDHRGPGGGGGDDDDRDDDRSGPGGRGGGGDDDD